MESLLLAQIKENVLDVLTEENLNNHCYTHVGKILFNCNAVKFMWFLIIEHKGTGVGT